MKKLFNLFLFVVTSLLLLSCEKEKYPGAYPYDEIIFFYTVNYIPVKQKTKIIELSGWNRELYPMELWVDNEEIATISKDGVLTGNKVGEVTIYARVMSIYGPIEDSIRYSVGEYLTQFSEDDLEQLFEAGVDIDLEKDEFIPMSKLSKIKAIRNPISDNLFFKILPYLENLDTLDIVTYNKRLDLSEMKLKKLKIHDGNYKDDFINSEEKFNYQLKPFLLEELILHPEIEELEIVELSGIPILDLTKYRSLAKIVKRKYYTATNRYVPKFEIIPPTSIVSIEYHSCCINYKGIYNNLTSLQTSNPYDESKILIKNMVISKEIMPNLKNIIIDIGPDSLDISTYEDIDLEFVKCDYTNRVYVSQSMYNSLKYSQIGLQHYQVRVK